MVWHLEKINDKGGFFHMRQGASISCLLTKFMLKQILFGDFVDLTKMELSDSIKIFGWINYKFKDEDYCTVGKSNVIILFTENGKLYRDYFPDRLRYEEFLNEVYSDKLSRLKNPLAGSIKDKEDRENKLKELETKLEDLKSKHLEVYQMIMELPQIYLVD